MKFRGRMIEVLSIRKFYSVIVTMAKIAKTCVMRLTADKVVSAPCNPNLTNLPPGVFHPD